MTQAECTEMSKATTLESPPTIKFFKKQTKAKYNKKPNQEDKINTIEKEKKKQTPIVTK